MNLTKLTIIIPTHERHNLLMRSMEYYNNFNINYIIVDSSQTAFTNNIPSKFKYLHVPMMDFGKKIYLALSHVNTEYSCLCADDDFISIYGLIQCLSFLDDNDDYVSAQGRCISFNGLDRKLTFFPAYIDKLNYLVDGINRTERVKQAFNPYMHQIYAVHKTNVLLKAFSVFGTLETSLPVELTVSLVGLIYGKHKMLPVFWMARDQLDYTTLINEKMNGQTYNSRVATDWKSYLLSEEGKLFKKNYCEVISEIVNDKKEQSRLFNAAFSTFSEFISELSTNNSNLYKKIKIIIKILIPNYFLHVYRIIKVASFRYKHPLGYPWSNKQSSDDWGKMKEVILKYSEIVRPK